MECTQWRDGVDDGGQLGQEALLMRYMLQALVSMVSSLSPVWSRNGRTWERMMMGVGQFDDPKWQCSRLSFLQLLWESYIATILICFF